MRGKLSLERSNAIELLTSQQLCLSVQDWACQHSATGSRYVGPSSHTGGPIGRQWKLLSGGGGGGGVKKTHLYLSMSRK